MASEIKHHLAGLLILPLTILLWGSSWDLGAPVDPRWLIPAVWGGFLVLRRAETRTDAPGRIAAAIRRSWVRCESRLTKAEQERRTLPDFRIGEPLPNPACLDGVSFC